MKISRKIGSLLVSSVALAALSLPAITLPAFAQAPAGKPNILFIMGDDIGIMQPSIYHRGLMVAGMSFHVRSVSARERNGLASSTGAWPRRRLGCRHGRCAEIPRSRGLSLAVQALDALDRRRNAAGWAGASRG
jgi:hypothetical protein